MEGNSILKSEKSGDEVALFEYLYEKYYNGAVYFANQYLADEEQARDVAQDAFIAIWERKEKVDVGLNVQSLILTIVKNKSLNILRKRISNDRYSKVELQKQDWINYLALKDASMDEFLQFEIVELVDKTLDEMPAKIQQVYRMSREDDLSYQEIAEQLDTSIKTVEYRMGRALHFFRQALKDYLPKIVIIINCLFELS